MALLYGASDTKGRGGYIRLVHGGLFRNNDVIEAQGGLQDGPVIQQMIP